MHWLGDITPLWHPSLGETFSQSINFYLMFNKLIDRDWDTAAGTWKPKGGPGRHVGDHPGRPELDVPSPSRA